MNDPTIETWIAQTITDPEQIRERYAYCRPRILHWTTLGCAGTVLSGWGLGKLVEHYGWGSASAGRFNSSRKSPVLNFQQERSDYATVCCLAAIACAVGILTFHARPNRANVRMAI